MNRQIFTKEDILTIINELLERPDLLSDAIHNEYTNYDAEALLNVAINSQISKENDKQTIITHSNHARL